MNHERFWKIANLISTIVCVVLTAIVIPWGTWVTGQIFEIRRQQVIFAEWKDIGPRYTSKDADNLKYQILQEVNTRLESKLDRLDTRIERVLDEIRRHILATEPKDK